MKIGVAVFGCGRIGQTHLRSITKLPDLATLVAAVDSREELARENARRFGAKKWYTSIEEALADDEIFAVVVALPHTFHTEVTVKAAKSGKHVLVEKPMAKNLEQANYMIEACQTAGVTLMVGQSRRFFRALQLSKARLNELGSPFSLNYIWAVYMDEALAPQWWKSGDSGVGIMPMLGSHTVDYTLWMFYPRQPVKLYARMFSNRHYFKEGDEAILLIIFDDGSMAVNHLSHNVRPRIHQCLIVCPHGNIIFKHDHLPHQPVGVDTTSLWINGQQLMEGEQDPDNFTLEMEEFLRSIREKRKPLASGLEVRQSIRLLEAAELSAREDRIVPIIA